MGTDPHGTLSATLKEAIRLREQMKADGATPAELDQYLEGVLRETWPHGGPYRYACERCGDTGLVVRQCVPGDRCSGVSTRGDTWKDPPGKYRRLCTVDPAYTHDYGVPCVCAKGDRFRPKATTVDFLEAVKVGKPTRFGR